jgi:predicted porin
MKTLATLGLMAAATIAPSRAAAADDGPMNLPAVEVYGTLLPFFENVGTSGATPLGSISPAPNLVSSGQFTGINHERRFRMTSGTSHLGFRGHYDISEEWLKLIWQVESPTPIDGEGPNTWASRNSHVGFSGAWGSLVYGNWDTPMKWVTATSVNPIKGGYVADMIPIIGAAGAQTPALNPDPVLLAAWQLIPNRAGFFRHETNTVQYWSPTVAGFSARVMFAANEHRTAGIPGQEAGLNPYLVSGSIGFDTPWLRLRYAAEMHNDYFGTSNLGGQGIQLATRSSMDIGHLALASVTINGDTPYKTRLVATGDYLRYHTDDLTPNGVGLVTDLDRMGAYALLQQTFGSHNLWGAYGMATEGHCALRGSACVTTGLSAYYITAGYLYSFTQNTGVYAIGYGLFNDIAARYSPFPILDSRSASAPFLPNIGEVSPGADTTGFGIGFVHSFSIELFGKEKPAAPAPARKELQPPKPEKKEPAPVEETKADEKPADDPLADDEAPPKPAD